MEPAAVGIRMSGQGVGMSRPAAGVDSKLLVAAV